MTDRLLHAALKLLARREHTRAELAGKLASCGGPGEVERVLDRLVQDGYLSDERYARSFVASRSRRWGAGRLRHELRQRGVTAELADQAVAEIAHDELQRAGEVWRRKFPLPPTDPRDWARQARFLQGRGFSAEVVRRILRGIEPE